MNPALPKTFRIRSAAASLLLVAFTASLPALRATEEEQAVEKATTALESKDYARALKDLAPVLKSRPDNPVVLNLQGAVLTKQKDYDAARTCYEKALAASPGFFPARYNLGALLALQHRWDEAIAYYSRMLIDQPNNELVQYKLLLLLLITGQRQDIQGKLFDTATPSNTPAWHYASAARAYREGRKSDAEGYIAASKAIFGDKTVIFEEELDESGLKNTKKP